MNLLKLQNGMINMPQDELEQLLEQAAARGTKRALADVGLEGEDAVHDIRELRDLLEAFNTAKHTARRTVIKIITTGFVLALVVGALLKIKLFGGQ
jgi:hypothetical protein